MFLLSNEKKIQWMKKASITWSTVWLKEFRNVISSRSMLTSAIYHFLPRGSVVVSDIHSTNNSYPFLIRKAIHVFIIQFWKYKNYEEENETLRKVSITFQTYICIFCRTWSYCMGAKDLSLGQCWGWWPLRLHVTSQIICVSPFPGACCFQVSAPRVLPNLQDLGEDLKI